MHDVRKYVSLVLLCFATGMLALHWVHLRADATWTLGPVHARDWSGDLYTDEGWETNAATQAALVGHWYVPGDFNQAVDAPLWPLILYLPFHLFGVSVALARGIAAFFFAGTVVIVFVLVRRFESAASAALVAALLAANFLGFTYGRLAMLEAVYLFFVCAALLLAAVASRASSWLPAVAAGFVLSLGLLTKLTAVFGIVPLVFILWRLTPRRVTGKIAAALVGTITLPLLHHGFVLWRYKRDHAYYVSANIHPIHAFPLWARHLVHLLAALYHLGPFLYACVCLSTLAYLFRNKLHFDVLTQIILAWLLSYIALMSTTGYFPPRYCLGFLPPVVILAVKFTFAVVKQKPWAGYALFTLLGASLTLNTFEVLRYTTRPHYTLASLSKEAKTAALRDPNTRGVMMGNFANTVSLYNGVPSVGDTYGMASMRARIQAISPTVYFSVGPATAVQEMAFSEAGRSLRLVGRFHVLGDYYGGEPVFLYDVEEPAKRP